MHLAEFSVSLFLRICCSTSEGEKKIKVVKVIEGLQNANMERDFKPF